MLEPDPQPNTHSYVFRGTIMVNMSPNIHHVFRRKLSDMSGVSVELSVTKDDIIELITLNKHKPSAPQSIQHYSRAVGGKRY